MQHMLELLLDMHRSLFSVSILTIHICIIYICYVRYSNLALYVNMTIKHIAAVSFQIDIHSSQAQNASKTTRVEMVVSDDCLYTPWVMLPRKNVLRPNLVYGHMRGNCTHLDVRRILVSFFSAFYSNIVCGIFEIIDFWYKLCTVRTLHIWKWKFN